MILPSPGGSLIRVAEAGVPEAVIPLNQRGATFARRALTSTAAGRPAAGAVSAPEHGPAPIHIGSVVLNVSPAELKDAAALVEMLRSLPQVARAGGGI